MKRHSELLLSTLILTSYRSIGGVLFNPFLNPFMFINGVPIFLGIGTTLGANVEDLIEARDQDRSRFAPLKGE